MQFYGWHKVISEMEESLEMKEKKEGINFLNVGGG
jgi:hypothetical protein